MQYLFFTLLFISSVLNANTAYTDDFSADTTSQYTTEDTWTDGGVGSFTYDSTGERVRVLTGNNVGLAFSHDLTASTEGSFSIDFTPTVKYPSGGVIVLKLFQNANTYYQIENTDGYGSREVSKYVNGLKVDSAVFHNEYTQNTNHTITVTFSPATTTVQAFGETVVMSSDTAAVAVSSFSVDISQQDAYCDNIVYSIALINGNIPPIADAGVNQNVMQGDIVTLNGSGSTDHDGTITAYEWKEGNTVLSTAVSFEKSDFNIGLHTIILMVTDNDDATRTDSMSVTVTEEPVLRPWSENPWYWSYQDIPLLLLGASDDDNLFQWSEEALLVQLDQLLNAGGNVIRNTMSDRKGNEGLEVYPFYQQEDGKYDLDQWNNEYWDRFERLLRETAERGIIVQIEIWDRFDYFQIHWENHPYNPKNNINYTSEESGFSEVYPNHPGTNEQPFFFTTPNQQNNIIVLQYQKRFVEKMLDYALQYDHIIYCMDNESSGAEEWSRYWAEYVQGYAGEKGRQVFLTEMWDDLDMTAEIHKRTFDHPELYTFVDISQNNYDGQEHWDNFIYAKEYLFPLPRPMNITKVYGADGYKYGDAQDAIERFWRNLVGGAASIRFHRPTAGLGQDEKAMTAISAARKLESLIYLWLVEPANALLSDREVNEAYLAVDQDRQSYVVYFPAGGEVQIDVSAVNGSLVAHWIDIDSVEWGPTQDFDGGDRISIVTPDQGNWVVAVIAHTP